MNQATQTIPALRRKVNSNLQRSKSHKQRFYEYFQIMESGCWEWNGGFFKTGYGQFKLNKSSELAHRASWILHNGEIPEKMCICHTCDNRKCVNPKHLFVGTYTDNMQDMIRKGRRGFNAGESRADTKFTNCQILEIRIRLDEGESQTTIAKEFNVDQTTIHYIFARKTWKHI